MARLLKTNCEAYAGYTLFDKWAEVIGNVRPSYKSPYTTFTGSRPNYPVPWDLTIKKIIFNDPATIVFWSDNTKTVVKCAENEAFDTEKGVAMCVWKKLMPKFYGNPAKRMIKEAEERASVRSIICPCSRCEHYKDANSTVTCIRCWFRNFEYFKAKEEKK